MHEKIGIFVNRTAQKQHKRSAVDLASKLRIGEPRELAFPLQAIPDEVETAIVVGGDGSVKAVMEELFKRKNPGFLLIVPAGSQNGLYRALTDEKSVVTLEQVQGNDTGHIRSYTPGSINGELFNHLADVTKAGTLQLKYAEALRPFTPREARAFAGIAVAYVAIRRGEDFPSYGIRTFMPTPFIGKRKVFPQQEVYGDEVTLVALEAKNKLEGAAKMGLFVVYALLGKMPPRAIAEVKTEKSFTVDVYSQELNIDGELRRVPNSGTIFVARHDKSLQAAALSLK